MELKYIRKDGAVITRVMTADEERSIPSKAKPDGILWKHFKYNNNYQVKEKCFKVSDLIGLSMVFGCEFAAYTQNGQLFIQKGNEFVQGEGIAGKVRVPQNARVLMHVHPVFTSYASHLDTDFAVMPNDVTETVVDYKFNIIIYRKDDEHGNMIYNLKKIDDGSLEQTDYKNPNWPDFLTKTPNQHVEIISV